MTIEKYSSEEELYARLNVLQDQGYLIEAVSQHGISVYINNNTNSTMRVNWRERTIILY